MRSVELFSGLGALALSLSRAGFEHALMVEWNADACETIMANKRRGIEHVGHFPIRHGDARLVDYSLLSRSPTALCAGGPPCQPFSIGGKHGGPDDPRDMWPEAVRCVRELRPQAFLFENVRGLLRPAFADYLAWIRLHLERPELVKRRGEDWQDQLARLRRAHLKCMEDGLRYNVTVTGVNAADYGAAQIRRRVVVVGFRSDLGIDWELPAPTHSREALLQAKWITGEYWRRHKIAASKRPKLSARERTTVERIKAGEIVVDTLPWVTTRDALMGLDEPKVETTVPNHKFQPGAKAYVGHTGSLLDEPAKALKAGDHGVPGGENMMAMGGGKVRYFTVREAARLQGLPDNFIFPATVSWTECMRQLGNAVPVPLGKFVGTSIRDTLRAAVASTRRRRAA